MGWSAMGKRVASGTAAVVGVGSGQRLASFSRAAGFTQIELAIEKLDVAENRQVLQVIDAFIERGQLKCKVESRA